MPSTVNLKASGLRTQPNRLTLPEGSLVEATNVIIKSDDVVESRRGFKLYGDTFGSASTRAKQLSQYRSRILRHYDSSLQFDDGNGNFTSFAGSYSEVAAGLRIKFAEAGGSLFFTTSEGVKKLSAASAAEFSSASGYIVQAGGVKALDTTTKLALTQGLTTGFVPFNSTIAYRVLWGIRDSTKRIILGTPSNRSILYFSGEQALIADINALLVRLDLVAAYGGGSLSDTNYYSTLALAQNSTATQIFDALRVPATGALTGGLTHKLDTDLTGNVYQNLTPPSYPTVPATGQMLTDMQTYLETILNTLKSDTRIDATARATYLDPLIVTTSAQVQVDFKIPTAINANYFYQIYRSDATEATGVSTLADVSPDDEMKLVYEDYVTAAQLSAGFVSILDETPDDFKGANLYTNPATGEGILQSNDPPPFCIDINTYKNYTFYANTRTLHNKAITLVAVTDLLNKTFVISNASTSNTYTFIAGVAEVTSITTVNFAGVTESSYFTINSANDATKYYVWFNKGSGVDPAITGATGIEISLSVGDTSAVVAQRVVDGLMQYASEDFEVARTTNVITVTNSTYGLSADAANGAPSPGFTITTTTQGVGNDPVTRKIVVATSGTVAENVEETARNIVEVINDNASEIVYAFYIFNPDLPPGNITLEARDLTVTTFYILGQDSALGSNFNPTLNPGTGIDISANTAANPTVVTTSSPHGLLPGDSVMISGSNSTPVIDGVHAITYISSTQFSLPLNVTVAGTSGNLYNVNVAPVASENEQKVNRLYYSKVQQSEAVPLLNYLDVGSADKAIIRIQPLRDSLFVFKQDGLWRVSGEAAPFSVSSFDLSCVMAAPDSLGLANNNLYCFTTQGVVTVTESGVSIISRDIDIDLLRLPINSNFSSATWGLGYESDNAYTLNTIQNSVDSTAVVTYRFSNLTNTWTTYDRAGTCGIVFAAVDRQYVGATDTNQLEEERKAFSRLDYADRELSDDLFVNNYFANILKLSDTSGYAVGDVVTQTQLLTPYKYNMLLKKLDNDPGVADNDYFSTLECLGGARLRDKIEALATKLDADAGVALTNFSSSIAAKSGTASAVSVGSPTTITSAGHGLVTGREVTLQGFSGGTSLNGTYTVTVTGVNTFTVPVNVTIVPSVLGTFTTSPNLDSFEDIKACYNKIIDLLNSDANIAFANYSLVTDQTLLESVILAVNNQVNELTLAQTLTFVVGPLTIYKAIDCSFTYGPVTLGDQLSVKHFSESTMMFATKAFTKATASFSTDNLPAYVNVAFVGDGPGLFGNNPFGENFFGGTSHQAPFRTYVPRDCQRCRFLNIKFSHMVAREIWQHYGTSVTGDAYSIRAYR